MNKKTLIYLARYTESGQNKALTEIGKAHANNLAERLKHVPFVAGISSDEMCAEATAKIILQYHQDVPLFTTSLLRELNYGEMQSTEKSYMFDQNTLSMRAFIENKHPENRKLFTSNNYMESDEELTNRLTGVLLQAAKDYEGQSMLIIVHKDVMRSILVRLGAYSYLKFGSGTIENTSLIKLVTDGVKFEAVSVAE